MRKRLLLLGGTSISRQIVYAAREMNMEIYVTDYLKDSPCKKIADKSFMVSCTDVDAVVNLIREEDIDGIIMGYADVLMPYYVRICQKACLPCYANLHAVETTTDKDRFKALCREYNVPVVPEYTLEEVERGNVIYPIIVKPIDNSGARGIFICHDNNEFNRYYPIALSYSHSKRVLIERFMTGPEATAFYYLHDGEIYLLGVGDRHMLSYSDKLLQLPIGYTFPSVAQYKFRLDEDTNIKRMFRSLDMKEGMAFVQSFNENGSFVVYEMGYRLTGSIEHHLMEKAYGFNHLKSILNFAVGNPVDVTPLKSEKFGNAIMANVTLLLSKGIIGHYEGLDECKAIPGVLHIHESYESGTVIDDGIVGTLAQVALRILICADDLEQLVQRMDAVKDCLHVISTEGNDLLLKNYSYKEIVCGR